MFKSLSNIANLVKAAGNIGERLTKVKKEMEHKRVRGRACEGDHQVLVELNGLGTVHTIDISESLFHPEHKSTSQRLLLEAMNHAVAQAKEMHVHAVRELTNGLDIPGLNGIIDELAR
jgi:hypothetical protein